MDDANWFVHVNLKRDVEGSMKLFRRPVEPYIVPLNTEDMRSYHRLRLEASTS